MNFRAAALAAVLAGAVTIGACGSDPVPPSVPSILAGLAATNADSAPPPTPQPTPGTGAFHGLVLGHGTGPDTMATAPRLQGVKVTAYPHSGWDGQEPVVGAAAAVMTTDGTGAYQSPMLPGGNYIITFVPPTDSEYRGVYVQGNINSTSDVGTWVVILPRKNP